MNVCLKFSEEHHPSIVYMWILCSTTAGIAASLYSLAHWQHFHVLNIFKSSANLALATWHPAVHLHMCRKLSISSSMQMLSATHVGTLMHSFWLPSSSVCSSLQTGSVSVSVYTAVWTVHFYNSLCTLMLCVKISDGHPSCLLKWQEQEPGLV